MTFEEWLKTVWQEDENRVIRGRRINELRERVKAKVVEVFEGDSTGFSGCMCDNCVAVIIRNMDAPLTNMLMSTALEYLLGENFNGAAAGYYYSYVKGNRDDSV